MWKLQFSINKIGHILIPHRHRTQRFIAWTKVFLSYLVLIKENLYLYWDETILDTSMTPQIIYLERMLNFRFESTQIFINEGYTLGPWIFRNTETPDTEFFMGDDAWVYSSQDAVMVDFTVNIPELLT